MEFICKLLPDMLESEILTAQEKAQLQLFHDRAAYRLNQIFSSNSHRLQLLNTIRMPLNDDTNNEFYDEGVSTIKTLFQDILDDLEINRKSLKKGEGALINAFYICILDLLRSRLITAQEFFKYPKIEEFLQVHGEKFAKESNKEKQLLWQTANWAHILFKMTIRAKTNRGLAMEVIPKLVEGWRAKYIVGGGMSSATANRKYLVYTEGNIPNKRAAESEGSASDSQTPFSPQKKQRNNKHIISTVMEEDFDNYFFANSASSSSMSYSQEDMFAQATAPFGPSTSSSFQQVNRQDPGVTTSVGDNKLDVSAKPNPIGGGAVEDCLAINPNMFKDDCLFEDSLSLSHHSILYEDEKVARQCICYLNEHQIPDTRYCPIHRTSNSTATVADRSKASPIQGFVSTSYLAGVHEAQPIGLSDSVHDLLLDDPLPPQHTDDSSRMHVPIPRRSHHASLFQTKLLPSVQPPKPSQGKPRVAPNREQGNSSDIP